MILRDLTFSSHRRDDFQHTSDSPGGEDKSKRGHQWMPSDVRDGAQNTLAKPTYLAMQAKVLHFTPHTPIFSKLFTIVQLTDLYSLFVCVFSVDNRQKEIKALVKQITRAQ